MSDFDSDTKHVAGMGLSAWAWLLLLMATVSIGAPESPNVGHLLVHVVDPFSGTMILPETDPLPGVRTNVLRIDAARGEYRAASFVVRPANGDITSVTMDAGPLSGPAGTIPAGQIDIKVVKAWYQAEGAWKQVSRWHTGNGQILAPELLLNDDHLIKVDYANRKNYLRVAGPAGEKYVWINDPAPFAHPRMNDGRAPLGYRDYPAEDAVSLQPVDLEEGRNKQIWVTVHVPAHADPGRYSGKITLKSNAVYLGQISIELHVLPFDLVEPKLTYSIYYRGKLSLDKPVISSEYKTVAQMRAELTDMFNHGVTNPVVYQGVDDGDRLRSVLAIRQQLGMGAQPLYLCGVTTSLFARTSEGRLLLKKAVSKALVTARLYGITQVYIYGKDEAEGEQLLAERQAWSAIHALGAKVFDAGSAGQFEAVGDLLDLSINGAVPSSGEAEKFHGKGQKIFMYLNPQVGVENPAPYRLNYGLLLWAAGYDGAMPYAYQDCGGSCWNDFDNPLYRDHMFTYPTLDGVIDTIAWEGFREGITDVRYMETLESHVEDALKSRDAALQASASAALSFLDSVRDNISRDVANGDVDGSRIDLGAIRSQTISHIVDLAATSGDIGRSPAESTLPRAPLR